MAILQKPFEIMGGDVAMTSPRNTLMWNMIAVDAITQGDVTEYDTTANAALGLRVVQSNTAGVSKNICGVAMHDAVAGQPVLICVAGVVDNVNVDGATVAGSLLVSGAGGQADIDATGTANGVLLGVALEADTANQAMVIVKALG